MHSPEPVLHAQNDPASQCLFLLHSAAAAPATQARARAATLMLCLDCLSFCYAAGLVEGQPPIGEAVRKYYQLPLTREGSLQARICVSQQPPGIKFGFLCRRAYPSLDHLFTFAFGRHRNTLQHGVRFSASKLSPR